MKEPSHEPPQRASLHDLLAHWAKEQARFRFFTQVRLLGLGVVGAGILALLLAQVGFTRLAAAVIFLTLVVGLGAVAYSFWRRRLQPEPLLATALAGEGIVTELGSAISTAVDLASKLSALDDKSPTFSRNLAEAHIARVETKLPEIDFRQRFRVRQEFQPTVGVDIQPVFWDQRLRRTEDAMEVAHGF